MKRPQRNEPCLARDGRQFAAGLLEESMYGPMPLVLAADTTALTPGT